jgi:hypothetical protein
MKEKEMRPKVKALVVSVGVAVLFGATWSYAQARDAGKDQDKCEMAGVLCSKEGECEGKCREACEQAAVTLHAVRNAVGERMKKEFGDKCPCTSGECTAENCVTCEFVKTKIFAPVLREKVAARLNDGKISLSHFIRVDDGKARDVSCVFLKGEVCTHCVDELVDATWKKANTMLFADIGATVEAVHSRIMERAKAEGGPKCPCLKGECTPDECPTCQTIKREVFYPLLKQKVDARVTDLQKDFTHDVKRDDGRIRTVACTLLRGKPCPHCANELADAVWKKAKEIASAQK